MLINIWVLKEIANQIKSIAHSWILLNYFIYFIYPVHLQKWTEKWSGFVVFFFFSGLCAEGASLM